MWPHLNVASCASLQFESFSKQQQIMEEELSDEWDFGEEQELTLLKFARKGTSNCCLGESQEKSFCGNHFQNLMGQEFYCGEYQRKSESDFQGVMEREIPLSDSRLKNKATLETPNSCSMSTFLSSMDNGKFDERKALQVDGQTILLLDGKHLLFHYTGND